jgi:hypothetical protein
MSATVTQHKTLCRLARAGRRDDTRVTWEQGGWLTQTLPYPVSQVEEPLELHGEWWRPTKLVGEGPACRQRTEVYLAASPAQDELLDDAGADELDEVLAEITESLFGRPVNEARAGWHPPAAGQLAQWLAEAGHSATIDEAQGLRLAVHDRGQEGQIKIVRKPGMLRMTMPLGPFTTVDPTAQRAMTLLARQANERGRLARIAWREEEGKQRYEAQVDLSGLPVGTGRVRDQLWRDMVRLAIDGLELALRRLAVELEVLADPRQRALAAGLLGPEK